MRKNIELDGFETVSITLSIGRGPTGIRPRWFPWIPSLIADPETRADIHRLEIESFDGG